MDRQQMSETLRELHVCGFTVLLDDYGTGYSSLQALEQLYFDVMKLEDVYKRQVLAGELYGRQRGGGVGVLGLQAGGRGVPPV